MNALQRWKSYNATDNLNGVVPEQSELRHHERGYFPSDAATGTSANAYVLRRFPDGTSDWVRLDQDGTYWFEQPGHGSRDFCAGRLF